MATLGAVAHNTDVRFLTVRPTPPGRTETTGIGPVSTPDQLLGVEGCSSRRATAGNDRAACWVSEREESSYMSGVCDRQCLPSRAAKSRRHWRSANSRT